MRERNQADPEFRAKSRAFNRSYTTKRYSVDAEYREKKDRQARACIARNQQIALEAKGQICSRCKRPLPPEDLYFHHRDPATKTANVSRLAGNTVSVKRLDAEIALCDVVCDPCHRVIHREMRKP